MTSELLAALEASLNVDIRAFLPELFLSAAIVLLLLVRLIPYFDRLHLGWLALFVTLYVCFVSWQQWDGVADVDPRGKGASSITLFGGMLIFDNFAIFLKMFLYSFVALVIFLCLLTGIPDREDSADFFCLLL